MPRMMRLTAVGSLTHVMARGIDGKNLFGDDEDRLEFLTRLGKHLLRVGHKCLTWCLMDNHYHLLLRTNENPLSRLMRPLNGGFARWFNKKYARRGYLFQDRYKSIICQDMEYARQLIRYINLNPLRGKKVHSLQVLDKWKWCGHAFLVGAEPVNGPAFQDREEALARFSLSGENIAIASYQSYLAAGIPEDDSARAGSLPGESEFEVAGSHKGWPAVIGDHEFARNALTRHKIGALRKHRQADYQCAATKGALAVCNQYRIGVDDLRRRGREDIRSEARAHFAYRMHCEELLPLAVIADYLNMTISPTARLVDKGRFICRGKAG